MLKYRVILLVLTWVALIGHLDCAKEKVQPSPKIIKKKLTPDFFKKSEEIKHSKTAKIGITDHRVLEVGGQISLSIDGLIPKHILIPEEQMDPNKEYTLYVGLLDFESFQVGINQGAKYGSSDLEMDYERKIDWVEKRYHFKYQANSSASQDDFKKHKLDSDPKSAPQQEPQAPIFEKTIDLSQRILPEGISGQEIPTLSLTDWDFSADLPKTTPPPTPNPKPQTPSPRYQTLNLAFRRESPSRRGTLAFVSPVKVVLQLHETDQGNTGVLMVGLGVVLLGFVGVVWVVGGWGRAKAVYAVLVG